MTEDNNASRQGVRRCLTSNPKSEAFWAFYDLATRAAGELRSTVEAIIPIRQGTDADNAIHLLAIYLGTLAEENAVAASELLMLDMSRAASVLVRQLYEYRIRFEFLSKNETRALNLINSLEKLVWKEANNAGSYFSESQREAYEANFKKWTSANPELANERLESNFKEMLNFVTDQGADDAYFRYYSYPSIIAHGQPHGIIDVLSSEQGGAVKRHFWQSRTLDWMALLSRIVSFTIELVVFIRVRFGLDIRAAQVLNEDHGAIQSQYGQSPITHEEEAASRTGQGSK